MASVQIWVDNLLRCKERDQLLKSFLWFSVHQKNLHVMAPSGSALDQRGESLEIETELTINFSSMQWKPTLASLPICFRPCSVFHSRVTVTLLRLRAGFKCFQVQGQNISLTTKAERRVVNLWIFVASRFSPSVHSCCKPPLKYKIQNCQLLFLSHW